MVNIYLLNYNSYYTRKIKKLSTIEEYNSYVIKSFTNINFIFNDGVDTTQILNYTPTGKDINYCIVEDLDNNSELSRWFVINSIRTRKGQYQISLHRDLIADNLKLSVYSTSYILKAYAQYGNPAFYSDERIDTSQILQKREYLTDKSGCSWLVAYLKPHNYSYTGESGGTDDPNKWENTSIKAMTNNTSVDYTFSDYATAAEAIKKYNNTYLSPVTIELGSQYWSHLLNTGGYYVFHGEYLDGQFHVTSTNFNKMGNYIFSYKNTNDVKDSTIFKQVSNFLLQYVSSSTFATLRSDPDIPTIYYTNCPYKNGDVFKCGDGYYKVTINESILSEDIFTDLVNPAYCISKNNLSLAVRKLLGSDIVNNTNQGVDPIRITKAKSITRTLNLVKINAKDNAIYTNFTISKSRNSCGSYDILATPYKTPEGSGVDVNFRYNDPDTVLSLFQAMTTTWSDDVVYDIQVLPYCPIQKLLNKQLSPFSGLTIDNDYSIYTIGTTVAGYIYYGNSADINFDISYNIPAITTKTDYICKKYKLVAPNFGSNYDIPVAKNWGIDAFNISMTALPYSPWIKVSPVFKGLNGSNYNDSRGLIFNGSLEITQLTDAFVEYQYSNSNYQSIFDRQIENSQTLYNIQHKQNFLSGGANVISSAISGGTAGAIIGSAVPGIGTVAGAVGGALLSGGASALGLGSDLSAASKTQAENIDYTKDQFALSMGNIKSQGTTISKITALNEANKLIPFIEYYDSADNDREAITNKLKYNGMSINRIGTIAEYANTSDDLQYYQTKLILPNGVDNGEYNYDYLNALGLELSQGFFADYDTLTMEV